MKKDILTYFVGKLLPMLVNLSFVILGVRYLGKVEYGKFSLIYSSLFTFFMLCFGWIQQGILRFNTKESFSKQKSAFFFTISFWMSILLMLIMIFSSVIYFKVNFLLSILIGGSAFLFTQLFYFLTIYQSNINSKLYALTESSFYMMWFAVSSVFIMLSFYNFWIGFVALFISLLSVISILYLKNISELKLISILVLFNEHQQELKKMLSYGLPIALWLFLSSAFNFADRFIIEKNYGYGDAGLYSTVYDLFFKLATFVCMPFLLSNHSRVVNEWNEKRYSVSWSIIKTSLILEIGLMIISMIVIFFLGEWALTFLTNIKLQNFNSIALPILAASFIWQIGMFVHKPLELYFKQWYLILAVSFSLMVNVSLNILFIPNYKFQAASFSTLIGTLVYVILVSLIIFWKKFHKLSTVENKV
jgi:O-antigen/teichoic acid export membrane protein